MTEPRIARSASLFVERAPGASQNVQSVACSSWGLVTEAGGRSRPRAPCSSIYRGTGSCDGASCSRGEQRRMLGTIGARERVLALDREQLPGYVKQPLAELASRNRGAR